MSVWLLLKFILLTTSTEPASNIIVKDIEELKAANKKAKPGDIIILQKGEWKDVEIKLDAQGTKANPITFKAQAPGKVFITGNSQLKLGGSFLVVEGLKFIRGYAGDDAVISYRINKDKLANDCRVTNCVINDFNNPKRMDENYWVAFYGKNNRLDHCSFVDKKNMGVLLAVILDDDRSRENFHSIDNNYFGRRIPLASNGGEIIRVGVSQHCQFNSNTQIKQNLFEECDGETEIVSIKSGNNRVENNIFKECQGSVVLRHGDFNVVSGNIFIGNDKPATGGVRVINKGQRVERNIFYKCRGTGFKSPIAIMNGIPNSPANRYVQVTEATITNNVFYDCSPMSFGEGSDKERTLPPDGVTFSANTFYNSKDSVIYRVWDDISGINFSNNKVSREIKQSLVKGFEKTLTPQPNPPANILKSITGYKTQNFGASWFPKQTPVKTIPITVSCKTAEEVYKQLEHSMPVIIKLTGAAYDLSQPFFINKSVQFTSDKKNKIRFSTPKVLAAFVIAGNGNLSLQNLSIDGAGIKSSHFISNDSSGSSDHFNLSIRYCSIENLDRANGCHDIFYAHKSMVADSLNFYGNSFANNLCNGIMMTAEKDDKGYYNAEKIFIGHNQFSRQQGELLNIYRGGNDESTLGPQLFFSHNKVSDCQSKENASLFDLTGVQVTSIFSNQIISCNSNGILIRYKDIVRAQHLLEKNKFSGSGKIEKNNFVIESGNKID